MSRFWVEAGVGSHRPIPQKLGSIHVARTRFRSAVWNSCLDVIPLVPPQLRCWKSGEPVTPIAPQHGPGTPYRAAFLKDASRSAAFCADRR